MGQSWPGKAPRPQTPECLLLRCAFTNLLLGYSLGSGMMLMCVGRSPQPLMQCVYLMEMPCSTWHFYLWAVMKIISS